ncbi:MAG: hypothetical protein K0S07_1607 [Chlamydiales bacterium]|jgi:hypothetical protein|nr:hypothetical protein [Chlamydiales bacterium]
MDTFRNHISPADHWERDMALNPQQKERKLCRELIDCSKENLKAIYQLQKTAFKEDHERKEGATLRRRLNNQIHGLQSTSKETKISKNSLECQRLIHKTKQMLAAAETILSELQEA